MKGWNQKAMAVTAILLGAVLVEAFQLPASPKSLGGIRPRSQSPPLRLWENAENGESTNQDDEKVEVGSKEYMQGFLSSPIQDENVAERGSGLEQALKLGGGVALVLVLLVVGFLASNGLI